MGHPDEELLDRYVDGALAAEERAPVEAHLAGCEACRQEVAALRELFVAFRSVPAEPLPIDLAPRVLRRIGPQAERRRRWVLTGVLAAQAALALALALWLVPPLVAGVPLWLPWAGFDPAGLRAWLPPRVPPLAALAPLQWALVVGGMAILWLVGNRLALAGERAGEVRGR